MDRFQADCFSLTGEYGRFNWFGDASYPNQKALQSPNLKNYLWGYFAELQKNCPLSRVEIGKILDHIRTGNTPREEVNEILKSKNMSWSI